MVEFDAHMLRVACPFFWHIGARNNGVPKGASAFILRFERGYVTVTCNRVLEQYADALEADARTICQLGTCQVRPEETLIDRNQKLDIATFEVFEHQLKKIGADTIEYRLSFRWIFRGRAVPNLNDLSWANSAQACCSTVRT
jgi:hypothetical protein